MQILQGKGVSGGIVAGTIQTFHRRGAAVRRVHITDPAAEVRRFETAKARTMQQLTALYEKALREVGESGAQVFEIHRMMVEDEDYSSSIEEMIRTQLVNGEYAAAVTADNFEAMFAAMSDTYMNARAADVRDVSNRLILNFTEAGAEAAQLTGQVILLADDLAPSETVQLDKAKLLAFVTESGSANSHTAILARTMNIPAVVGVSGAADGQWDGKMAIVDGTKGTICIDPTEEQLLETERQCALQKQRRELLARLKGQENVTQNGTRIEVYANIGGIDDIGEALHHDAGGVGLFRSEFLYLEQTDYPSEQQQLAAYRRALESMAGKPVVIRTLDIGADKQIGYFNLPPEENPAMGMRAIRICLTRRDIFRTQLRALLRASVYGRLSVMFPMITSVEEVQQIKGIWTDVMAELEREGLPFRRDVDFGIMIETPAAALISDKLAPLVDFFSVGTNDLIQYTLACDRQNADVEPFCDTHHTAVLRLIQYAAENIHKEGKWIGICGELAADLSLTETFLQMGIDELSVPPAYVLPLREKIRSARI